MEDANANASGDAPADSEMEEANANVPDADAPLAEQPPLPPSELLRRALAAGADRYFGVLSHCRLRCTCSALHSHAWRTLDFSACHSAALPFFRGPSLHARFGGVTELNLSFCAGLRDEHLQSLPPSAALQSLTLDGCHGVTDAGVKLVAERCGRALEHCSLYWMKQVTSSSALALSLRCPRLRRLSLSGCQKVDSTGVLALASRCRELVALDLTRLPRVDDVALGAVVQANGGLAELRLYACSQYTDAPLIVLAAHSAAALHTLDLTGLAKLTDAALLALAAHCAGLRTLLLTWCTKLSDAGVCAVAAACPLEVLSLHGLLKATAASRAALVAHRAATLRALDVRGCSNMPSRDPAELRAALPRLHTFALAT